MENFVLAQRNFKVQNKAVSLDYPDPKKIRFRDEMKIVNSITFSARKKFIVLAAEFIVSQGQSNEFPRTSSLFVHDAIKLIEALQPL